MPKNMREIGHMENNMDLVFIYLLKVQGGKGSGKKEEELNGSKKIKIIKKRKKLILMNNKKNFIEFFNCSLDYFCIKFFNSNSIYSIKTYYIILLIPIFLSFFL